MAKWKLQEEVGIVNLDECSPGRSLPIKVVLHTVTPIIYGKVFQLVGQDEQRRFFRVHFNRAKTTFPSDMCAHGDLKRGSILDISMGAFKLEGSAQVNVYPTDHVYVVDSDAVIIVMSPHYLHSVDVGCQEELSCYTIPEQQLGANRHIFGLEVIFFDKVVNKTDDKDEFWRAIVEEKGTGENYVLYVKEKYRDLYKQLNTPNVFHLFYVRINQHGCSRRTLHVTDVTVLHLTNVHEY